MTDKLPLSVFIICKNEADRISKTITSVIDWVDEIIVIDSGSTDNTVELCQSFGVRTEFHEWQGFGPQKRFGESLCKHDWILNLDADEEVTEGLKKHIITLFEKGKFVYAAYRVKRVIIPPYSGKYLSFGPGDHFVRLYNKHEAEYRDSPVHDSVILKSEATRSIGTLKGILLHRSFRSYKHMVDKINFYSSMQAEDLYARKRHISGFRLLYEPLLTFLKAYIIRRYFLCGVDGISEAVIYAFARTLRIAKLRELERATAIKE